MRREGISTWVSTARSTAPGTAAIASRAAAAMRRNSARSVPKILTAIAARVPESMWSMRCEIGCPTENSRPGIIDSSSRSRASISSRSSKPGSSRTSISEYSTPSACSSSSARPVRRATVITPGCLITTRSAARTNSSLCSSEVPGSVTAVRVSAPSWNSGRKAVPKRAAPTPARISSTATPPSNHREWLSTAARVRSYPLRNARIGAGSRPVRTAEDPGSSRAQSTGVTVTATSKDAARATT